MNAKEKVMSEENEVTEAVAVADLLEDGPEETPGIIERAKEALGMGDDPADEPEEVTEVPPEPSEGPEMTATEVEDARKKAIRANMGRNNARKHTR
jgi:hypothetical protein